LRDITEDDAVNGASDGDDARSAGSWAGRESEWETVFGRVSSRDLAGEWAALADGPPWQLVRREDVAGQMAAFGQASGMADGLRGLLRADGLSVVDVPEVCPDVDMRGRPVVTVVKLSVRAVERLSDLLRAAPGRPVPPATEEKGKAA